MTADEVVQSVRQLFAEDKPLALSLGGKRLLPIRPSQLERLQQQYRADSSHPIFTVLCQQLVQQEDRP